jgi:hypothetical protein
MQFIGESNYFRVWGLDRPRKGSSARRPVRRDLSGVGFSPPYPESSVPNPPTQCHVAAVSANESDQKNAQLLTGVRAERVDVRESSMPPARSE